MTTNTFPELARPPIVEVVCGVVFDSFLDLDALLLGVYWNTRAETFPKRSLQPALTDEVGLTIGAFPMRVVLSTADDQFLLQLQHDRFFMNWRSTGQTYPRFSERHGADGLLVRALNEFEKFASFLEKWFGRRPNPRKIDLAKIDVLRRGEHWHSMEDLSRMVPVTGVFKEIQRVDSREVNLRFVERGAEGAAIIHLATITANGAPVALRVEGRYVAATSPDLAGAFHAANAILNDAFFKLIPGACESFGIKGEH